MESLKAEIFRLAESTKDNKDEQVTLIKALYYTFIKENVVGPSVYTVYVEETKAPLDKDAPLPENELDPISNKNQELQNKLLQHFERDSEQIYQKV